MQSLPALASAPQSRSKLILARVRLTRDGRRRRLARQPAEVVENAGDQLLVAWIAPHRGRREQAEQITRLLRRLSPGRRRSSYEEFLEFRPARTQRRLISFDLRQSPADFGGLLRSHPTVLV